MQSVLLGTAFSAIVLHVAPEAAIGGPLAAVRNGDRIRRSTANKRIDLVVDEAAPCCSRRRCCSWLADRRSLPDFRRGAAAINRAIDCLVKSPETRTRDLGGQLGTAAFTGKLCAEIERACG